MNLAWGERSHLDVDGVAVHVERRDGDGPPIALLHGFASGTFTWAGLADQLGRRRLVAWDRPPFGRSDRPAPMAGPTDPYRLERVLHEARAVLDDAAAERPILIGHSAGCLVAAQLVAAGLDVSGLGLIAPALEGGPPAPVLAAARSPLGARIGAAGLAVALRGATPALRLLGRHRNLLSDATAVEAGAALRRPGTAPALWHLTRTYRPTRLSDLDLDVGGPVVVIGGADDRLCPPPATGRVADRLGVVPVILPGLGHAPHEHRPDLVADALEPLLTVD